MQISFGRFTDSFKTKTQSDCWTETVNLFEQKKYFDSYKLFIKYISNPKGDNIKSYESDGTLKIEFIQGSKMITVNITDKKITAESIIAKCEKLSISYMRRLLELNYSLFYSRFTLNNNLISIKFDSSILDCFPEKLYYALKELSVKADKQDDLLLDEFSTLKPTENSPIISLSDDIRKLKLEYFKKWINDTINMISALNENTFDGGISYLLLSLLYRIDYLLTPEGSLVDEIENISSEYFSKEEKKWVEKNSNMRDKFKKLLSKPDEEILKSFYITISTFSILNPVFHQPIVDIIDRNIGNVKYYVDNNYEEIALRIYEYIAGYCFYSYGMAKPVAKLLQLVYRIVLPGFFNSFDSQNVLFNESDKKLDEDLIKRTIASIIDEDKEQFPELSFNSGNLKFDSRLNFLSTFFNEFKTLKYN